MPTNEINNNVIEVMDEQDLYEQYGYEPEYDDEPVDPNELLVEDEYPECEVTFAESPLPVAFQGAVVAPAVEAVEEKTAEQTAETETTEDQTAETSDKEAQAAAIAAVLAKTDGAPRLSDTTEAFFATPPTDWMVKGIVQVGGVTLINGDSFDGKSMLTMDMMTSIIAGEPWCGRETKQASVFYFDYDAAKTVNVERFRAILRYRGAGAEILRRWHFISADNLEAVNAANPLFPELFAREVLTSPEFDETVETDEPKRAVIVVDTLRAFCAGVEMNDNTAMTLVMQGFQKAAQILQKCGFEASVVVLHHYRKDNPNENRFQAKTFAKKITAAMSYNSAKALGAGTIIGSADVVCHVVTDPQDRHHKALVETKNKGNDQWIMKFLDMRFNGKQQGDTLVTFGIDGMDCPVYFAATQDDDDSETPAPRYNSRSAKAAPAKIDYDGRVLQYISEHPGVGRFEVRNAGVINANLSKSIIDRLIAEGKLVEGASAGSARKGQGLYIA